jgi:hypothetical protein
MYIDFKHWKEHVNTQNSITFLQPHYVSAREENVLQGMIDRITEIGRRYGMEMNVEKN